MRFGSPRKDVLLDLAVLGWQEQGMGKVLVVGSSVVDLTFYTGRIPAVGETVTGKFVQGLGGKGFNQAVACALSGTATRFISALGPRDTDAFAPLFIQRLEALGIESALQFLPGQATGAAAISVGSRGENSIIVSLGANESLSPEFLDAHAQMFAGISALVMQFETNFRVIEHALRLTRQHSPQALTILNPAPALPDIPGAILKEVDLFTPNETELATISGHKILSDVDLPEACRRISGPKAILATLGERGCYYYKGETRRLFPAFRVNATDTSGAGDAFNGALASGWVSSGGNLDEAVRFASAVGAISVTRPGTSASMPQRDEVTQFLREHA